MTYPDLSGVRRILVAKLRHHGDVLLTTPLFSALKRAVPQARIDAYIYAESAPLLRTHPDIEELILYDRGARRRGVVARYRHELEVLRKIRKGGYDIVINLTEGDRGAIAAKVSKAPIRVGFDPKGSGMKGKSSFYTHIVCHGHAPRHTVEKQLDAARVLGIFPDVEQRELSLPVSAEVEEKIASYRGAVVVHPVSRWMFKALPSKTMIEVIGELEKRGERVIITASPDPSEMAMGEEIGRASSASLLAGETTLEEMAALVKGAKLLITLDSLPLHMASVYKTPVVALFGPTSEVTWGPWRHPRARAVTDTISCRPCFQRGCGGSGRSDCLEQVTARAILRAVSEVV